MTTATLTTLEPLTAHTLTLTYHVMPADSVRAVSGLGDQFRAKPDVMASCRMLALVEWPCMEMLARYISLEDCSLGREQRVDHRGPVLIGSTLTVAATCTSVLGPRTDWNVTVHDDYETVVRAHLAFVVDDQARFAARRIAPKLAHLARTDDSRADTSTSTTSADGATAHPIPRLAAPRPQQLGPSQR